MSTLLYHWSPTDRRRSIQRVGLVPRKRSTDGQWRPPYVCLSDSPSLAWSLSGATARGRLVASWDLWCVWTDRLDTFETVPFHDNPSRVKEYRVHDRIYKRHLWYVGTRQAA